MKLRDHLSSELNILNNIPSANFGLEHLKKELSRFFRRREHQLAIKLLDHYINHNNLEYSAEDRDHTTDNLLRIKETLRELLAAE